MPHATVVYVKTTDTSMRNQIWGLKVAIYLPDWVKYRDMHNSFPKPIAEFSIHFFPWIKKFRFTHHFLDSFADNLKWCTFSPQADLRTTMHGQNIIYRDKRFSKVFPLRNHYLQGMWAFGQREGMMYQMKMSINSTHQYEYRVFCDP